MQNLQIPNNRNAQKRPISPNVTGDARTVVDSLSNSVLQITREIASFEDEKVESFAELQRKTNETNDKLRQLRTALQVRGVAGWANVQRMHKIWRRSKKRNPTETSFFPTLTEWSSKPRGSTAWLRLGLGGRHMANQSDCKVN